MYRICGSIYSFAREFVFARAVCRYGRSGWVRWRWVLLGGGVEDHMYLSMD